MFCRDKSVCEQVRQNDKSKLEIAALFFFRKMEDSIYPFRIYEASVGDA